MIKRRFKAGYGLKNTRSWEASRITQGKYRLVLKDDGLSAGEFTVGTMVIALYYGEQYIKDGTLPTKPLTI